jgi:hypothetical protein
MAPDLHLEDSVQFIKFVMLFCFGGLDMPEHWFSSGGDVNKATAGEMGTAIFPKVRDRKRQIRNFMQAGAHVAMQRVRERGGLAGIHPGQLTWEVVSRDPDRTTYDLIGSILVDLGNGLEKGVVGQWLSQQEAAVIFRTAISGLGLGDLSAVPPNLTAVKAAARDALDKQSSTAAGRLKPLQMAAQPQQIAA